MHAFLYIDINSEIGLRNKSVIINMQRFLSFITYLLFINVVGDKQRVKKFFSDRKKQLTMVTLIFSGPGIRVVKRKKGPILILSNH